MKEAIASLRRIAEKKENDIILQGNRLTPPSLSTIELMECIEIWGGLVRRIDSEAPNIISSALNILAYMVEEKELHQYMTIIIEFMEYRHIKQYIKYVSIYMSLLYNLQYSYKYICIR